MDNRMTSFCLSQPLETVMGYHGAQIWPCDLSTTPMQVHGDQMPIRSTCSLL